MEDGIFIFMFYFIQPPHSGEEVCIKFPYNNKCKCIKRYHRVLIEDGPAGAPRDTA